MLLMGEESFAQFVSFSKWSPVIPLSGFVHFLGFRIAYEIEGIDGKGNRIETLRHGRAGQ